MKDFQQKLISVVIFVIFNFRLTSAKEYKFCSKDKSVLYSFTSEACPGGIFLKEPLIIDPQCYCHDTDIQLYNYCNLAQADPRLQVPYSRNGCQKSLLPMAANRPPGYNKIRLMLLSDTTTPPEELETCDLPCANSSKKFIATEAKDGASYISVTPMPIQITNMELEAENATNEYLATKVNSLIKQRENETHLSKNVSEGKNGIPGLKEPYDYNYFSIDPLAAESGLNNNWREARSGTGDSDADDRLLKNTMTGPKKPKKPTDPINPETGPTDSYVEPKDPSNPTDPNVDPADPINPTDTKDPTGPYVDPAKPTDPYIDPNDPTNPAGPNMNPKGPMGPNPKPSYNGNADQPGSNSFTLIKDALSVYTTIVPDSVIDHDVLKKIYELFYSKFQSVDNSNTGKPKLDAELLKIVTDIFTSCKTSFRDLSFSTDSKCPPKILTADDVVSKLQFTEISAPIESNFRNSMKPGQDFLVTTIAVMVDSVITKCSTFFADQAQKDEVYRAIQDFFATPEIKNQWTQRHSVESYKDKLTPLKCGDADGDWTNIHYNVGLIQEALSKTEKPSNGTVVRPKPPPCNPSELCDQFPPYPESGLTDAQKQDIINNNAQNPLTGGMNIATARIASVSSTFDAIHKAVSVYERLVPPEVAKTSLLDEILNRFHLFFENIDSAPGIDHWRESEKDRVMAALDLCYKRTMTLEFTYDDGCPARVQKLKQKGKEVEIKPPAKTEKFWEGNQFIDLGEEDLVVGTMFKVIDTVASHCEELHKTAVKKSFTGAFIGLCRNNLPIYNKWFGMPAGKGVTSYTGILRHDDLNILSENIDKVDVTVHMLAKLNASMHFYKKPVPNGKTPPGGRGRRNEGYSGSSNQYNKPSVLTDFTWDFNNGNNEDPGDTDFAGPEQKVDVSQYFDKNEADSSENFKGPVIVVKDLAEEEPGARNDWRRRRKRSPLFKQGLAAKNENFKRPSLLKPTAASTTTETPVFIAHPESTTSPDIALHTGNLEHTAVTSANPEITQPISITTQVENTKLSGIATEAENIRPSEVAAESENIEPFNNTERAENTNASDISEHVTNTRAADVEKQSEDKPTTIPEYTEDAERLGTSQINALQANTAEIEAKPRIPEHTTIDQPQTPKKVLKIPETAPDDAHLIWGGRAYCLQKKNPTLPATVANVYPDVIKLCQKHGHKCQPPVQKKGKLQSSILEGCVKSGWESIFLKLNSEDNLRILSVCCYDGKLCGPSITTGECIAKCKAYCIEVGADPQAKKFYEDGRCLCSSTQAVRLTYLNIIAAGG